MPFTSDEIRAGATSTGYVLMTSQADLDSLPVKAIVQDNDDEACQKDASPTPFRNVVQPPPQWYIAGRENPQRPQLPAALVWYPGMKAGPRHGGQ